MLRPLLKLFGSKPSITPLSKKNENPSGLSGPRHGTPQKAWLSSSQELTTVVVKPALKDGRQFARLPETTCEPGDGIEEWEMQRSSGEPTRMDLVGKGG